MHSFIIQNSIISLVRLDNASQRRFTRAELSVSPVLRILFVGWIFVTPNLRLVWLKKVGHVALNRKTWRERFFFWRDITKVLVLECGQIRLSEMSSLRRRNLEHCRVVSLLFTEGAVGCPSLLLHLERLVKLNHTVWPVAYVLLGVLALLWWKVKVAGFHITIQRVFVVQNQNRVVTLLVQSQEGTTQTCSVLLVLHSKLIQSLSQNLVVLLLVLLSVRQKRILVHLQKVLFVNLFNFLSSHGLFGWAVSASPCRFSSIRSKGCLAFFYKLYDLKLLSKWRPAVAQIAALSL